MLDPIYDSRETGPRFHITSWVGGRLIAFQHRIEDPFVNHTIQIGWKDLLRALLTRRSLKVNVVVGGDHDLMEAVLELDGNYLGRSDSERRKAFNGQLNTAIGGFADDEEFREITQRLAEGDS